ncbi:cobalamin-binding protein [Azonexus sp.]|jgi:iron complex transport system substrate-binding protein|uniref:cobalamin-binding protein n=1 Tax=Azonexus sp. TaxID=1872668 RepID=UPI00283580FF|nr:cobalamin-binding protein [Azonexus sp.]MDR1995409.1 cobalamin-binding protein [Azonexus sp.]
MSRLPQRIVCLTTETVEVLYALGEQDRIAGISGYTVRPPQARKEKPKVFAFTHGDIDKILAVRPDLVLTFSDLQAAIAHDLIKAGVPVHAFNMRSIEDILGMVETLGRLVGAEERALALIGKLEAQIGAAHTTTAERLVRNGGRRPRVYFEEWDEPLISGIRWVSELIEIAGGEDVFATQSRSPLARDRQLTPEAVLAAAPEIIIGSWCGKHFRPERIAARPGWADLPAVRDGRLHEIKSAIILTPGPVAISEGLPLLQAIFDV